MLYRCFPPTVLHTLRSIAAATLLTALGACSTAPTGRTTGTAQTDIEIPSRLSAAQATEVTIYAMSLVGTPYRFGGNTPESGFDCSGLIGHVYKAQSGVLTPRTVSAMSAWGQAVPLESVRTGDLAVFTRNGTASHAGIYVGAGRFVHAPSTGGTVRLETLLAGYWSKQQVSYRRP